MEKQQQNVNFVKDQFREP